MRPRLFTLASAISTLLFVLLGVAWLLAARYDTLNPSGTQFLSLSSRFHVTIDAHAFPARIVFFSDSTFGPYAGAISAGRATPTAPQITRFGDTAGIYYRHFRWPNGKTLWTLSLSLLYPLSLCTILPTLWLLRRSRLRTTARGFEVTNDQ
jgi:hypothetical protein